MSQAELIAFHSMHSTPLIRLGNSVHWFEECAERASGIERQAFKRKAKTMRAVVTALFIERHTAGEYDALPVAA